MKKTSTVYLLALMVLGASSAMAQDAKPEAAKPATETAEAAKDEVKTAANDAKTRMVCTNERVTGSRFTKRVCLTQEESDRLREAGKEAVERVQRMPIPVISE